MGDEYTDAVGREKITYCFKQSFWSRRGPSYILLGMAAQVGERAAASGT